MKKLYLTLCLIFCVSIVFSQQKERILTISCYVNPELYLKAGVIAFVSDRSGSPACKGSALTIYNGSSASFYYRLNHSSGWKEVKPKLTTTIPVSGHSSEISEVHLNVKYQEDNDKNLMLKMKTIAKMNAENR